MMSLEEYRAILRQDFLSFVERSFYELNPQTKLSLAGYLEVMAAKLEACRQGKIKRLIVNLPPRHLKSHTVSVAFVSWLLGHAPALQIICASYGQDLADKLARDTRRQMNSAFYKELFATRLSDRQAVHDFLTTENGCRMATSVGGVLTGRGADVIIIDDPQKPDEAMSETGRKAVNEWYENTLLSRLNSKKDGVIIIVMQRLHQDDLVGHVLELEDWEVVSFPAIAEEDEVFLLESPLGRRHYHRKTGDVLDPHRESQATLAALRQSMGPYAFASQYQQNPVPIGGNLIQKDWLRFYSQKPEHFSLTILSLDTASKAKEINDYSVGTVWGYQSGSFYLLDVLRKRLIYPDLKRAVVQMAQEHQVDKIVIEDKSSGIQLLQDLQAEGLCGLVPYAPLPGSDKTMRLLAQTTVFEAGKVFLPAEAPWFEAYIQELTGFPGTKFDDQVDSTTQALDYLRSKATSLVWERL
jgi:predicted phage terminase large subunit-like protein